jgi:hypothetical protein
MTEEKEKTKGAISSCLVTGTMARLGDDATTAEPAVEQSGQMCELEGPEVTSAQK